MATRPQANRRSAADFLPARRSLKALREAAQQCQGCELYRGATQTVFGEGSRQARLVLVGEQPGDREDTEGHPFVGPAGRLLDEVLEAVGIVKQDVYITNAVKHFKWRPAGKRRLHKKPTSREISACRPWLDSEIEAVRPEMVVCLGATAAGVLLGPGFRITKQRGEIQETEYARWTMATYHPSAVLRVPGSEARRTMRALFSADLQQAADHLHRLDRSG